MTKITKISNIENNIQDILKVYKKFTPSIHSNIIKHFYILKNNAPRTSLVSTKKDRDNITIAKVKLLMDTTVIENNKNLTDECMKELEPLYQKLATIMHNFNN